MEMEVFVQLAQVEQHTVQVDKNFVVMEILQHLDQRAGFQPHDRRGLELAIGRGGRDGQQGQRKGGNSWKEG